ncbi:MAG: galactonate dehydratase [Sedimentisphaerales bacterium]|nr:galactonate dehydratase [Sedimentisphaerales bacterium]
MKITGVKAFVAQLPGMWTNYVFVKVTTDEGIVGWGECSVGIDSVANVVEELGRTLVGKDPFRIEEHWQALYHIHHNVRGGVLHTAAISGIEIALWDIKGKVLGVPIYEMLGGAMRDKIWGYGRFDGDTQEAAVEHALSQVAEGFTALKGDPFAHQGLYTSPASERDAVAKVAAVRKAVGDDVELMVEVHGRLTPAEAICLGEKLEEYRPFWYEEPVPPQNADAMEQVARAINIPLATGERLYTKWDFKDLLERKAVAVVQPDPCQSGGILELKKIAAMAETYYVGFAPHNPYGPVNTMAALHVVTCTPNFLIQEGGHADYGVLCKEPFPHQKNGYFDIPKGPGLGIELDEEALLKHPSEGIVPMGYNTRFTFPSRQQSRWI